MAAMMRMCTALAAGALLVALAAACGAQPEPPPRPTATAAPAPASPQPTTASATPVAGDTPGWRTDREAGGRVGNAAPNVSVTLTDGTTATLEELAGGKPLLLYFFATW
ncbi:MAG: hypothetical protein IIC95_09550 [Chloroflexi bacterium]|nr:hypothetical protein [Chloroflexota bacterium]